MEVKILSWDILKLLPQIVPQIPLLGRNQKSYWGKRKDIEMRLRLEEPNGERSAIE